jgi:hypothetical protein
MKAESKRQRLNLQTFQPCGFSPLLGQAKVIVLFVVLTVFFTGCCAPAMTPSTLPETAFTATFLGLSHDGQTLLVQPEQSKDNVQLVYNNTKTLIVGQRVYVVGRLEGNLVHVTDLRLL